MTIAVANAFSDASGIHASEESENAHSARKVWESTGSTFAAKLVIALPFVIPILLLPLDYAITAGVIYGMVLLSLLSLHIARAEGKAPSPVVAEHLIIALVVVIVAHYIGDLVRASFGV